MKKNLDFEKERGKYPEKAFSTCPHCGALHEVYTWIEEPQQPGQSEIECFGITCPKFEKSMAIFHLRGFITANDAKFNRWNTTAHFTHEYFKNKTK